MSSRIVNSGTRKPLPPKPQMTPVQSSLPKLKKVKKEEEPKLEDPDVEEEPTVRAPRKKATIADHIKHYDQLFSLLDSEIDRKSREKEKGTRSLRTIRKVLIQMRKDLPQVTRSKEARKQSSTRKETKSGLMMQFPISKELADFLNVPGDTRLSRVEVTRAICVYAHIKENEKRDEMIRWKHLNPDGKRNLQFPQDKKAIIPDKALTKLLRYDAYKKKIAAGQITRKSKNKETGITEVTVVKTEALYYWAIQSLLSVHFLKEDLSEGEDEDQEEDQEGEAEDQEGEEEDQEGEEEDEGKDEDEEDQEGDE